MSTMRAVAVAPGRRELSLVSEPVPALRGPRDVKLRILDVGVCGTDKEICAFEYGTPPAGSEHLVIGHESLGEVVETGPEVMGFKPGDLVVTTVRRPCPHASCLTCRAGRQDYCFTGDFTERGIKQQHGFMTEFVVDDFGYMNLVPRELRRVGVLVEPLTIAEKALLQIWDVQERLRWTDACPGEPMGKGRRAVVLGAGPVGLLGAMALMVSGFETTVYSRDLPDGSKARLVTSIGARYVSSQLSDARRLDEEVGPIDLVYEAVGVADLIFDVMNVLAPNGAFVLTGVPPLKDAIPVQAHRLLRRMVLGNQVLLGSVNAGKDAFEGAIRHLAVFQQRWPAALGELITGRFPVEAHRDLLLGRPAGIKNVISFDAAA
jgi:threonine dehydrogenase-like Zn-dependent dehydrogenase